MDRALVEFRNVFQLDGKHLNARLTYARIQRERGEFAEAYSQYLLVVEQYPDNLEGRLALAEMAIDRNDWQEAQRHGQAAFKLAPEDPMAEVIAALLDYQTAAVNKDSAGKIAPAAKVQALLDAHADNKALALLAYRVLIDQAYTGPDPVAAMAVLDKAIALNPNNFEWQMLKLRLLINAGDQAAVGAQLNTLYSLFPQDKRVRDLLIGWYMQQKDLDGAEAFLRRLADDAAASSTPTAARDAVKARLNVVQFLRQARDLAAAQAELAALVAADPANIVYQATAAAMQFEAGQKDEAVAALTALVKAAPDDEDSRNAKVALARMLQATGNNTGAQALIEEVLVSDPSHVAALKMKAAWLIQADKPGDAIIALRTALDQDPKDADILTLMAEAHERDGARDLAGERYAAAVDVSGRRRAGKPALCQFPDKGQPARLRRSACWKTRCRSIRAIPSCWRRGPTCSCACRIGTMPRSRWTGSARPGYPGRDQDRQPAGCRAAAETGQGSTTRSPSSTASAPGPMPMPRRWRRWCRRRSRPASSSEATRLSGRASGQDPRRPGAALSARRGLRDVRSARSGRGDLPRPDGRAAGQPAALPGALQAAAGRGPRGRGRRAAGRRAGQGAGLSPR